MTMAIFDDKAVDLLAKELYQLHISEGDDKYIPATPFENLDEENDASEPLFIQVWHKDFWRSKARAIFSKLEPAVEAYAESYSAEQEPPEPPDRDGDCGGSD
jgi:hypothetical protein